ncbi:MAG TPA: hypothetical protein P5044_02095, partial [bacterium]|nr:hypothetical protein [bacterium]
MRKKSFFISIALFFLFEIVFAEEACELIEDGQLCEREDGMIFISPMIMEQIYNESLVGPFASFQPNASFFTLNGLVEPFAEDLQIDVVNKNYTIFSLTNFRDTQNRIHDLVTSIKSQGFGDCAKFAAAGVIEIESMRIYNNIFQEAKNVVSFNGGDTNNVEIDLSEAFLQEINGCTSSSVKIGESLVSRGVVQEEHYPYVHRGFGKPKYYSKRDVNRFKDFKDIGSVYGCTTGIDEDNSWNYELFNKSVDVGWLVFRPNDILFLQRNINTVKEYIRNGKPLVMSFQSHCLNKERILEVTGAWGKFNNMKINSTSASKTGGHAVVVVGYITPTDGNG